MAKTLHICLFECRTMSDNKVDFYHAGLTGHEIAHVTTLSTHAIEHDFKVMWHTILVNIIHEYVKCYKLVKRYVA